MNINLCDMFSHFVVNYFQCGFKNCHAEFPTELQMMLHCEDKHRRKLKVLILTTSRLLDFVISTCTSGVNQKDLVRSTDWPRMKKVLVKNANLLEKKFWKRANDENSLTTLKYIKQMNFVKCKKCRTAMRNTNVQKRAHCFHHLVIEGRAESCYKCLLCSGGKYMSIMGMVRHVQKVHTEVSSISPGIHYLDELKKYTHQIDCTMIECFADSDLFKKRSSYCGRTKHERCKHICSKCFMTVTNRTKRKHILFHHLKNHPQWLFKCLLCPNNKRGFKSMHYNSVNHHFRRRHKKWKPKSGFDYVDRRREFSSEIEELMHLCFKGKQTPVYKIPDKPKPRWKPGLRKCLKCAKVISGKHLDLHSAIHLQQRNPSACYFKCLLCSKFPYKTFEFHKLQHHMLNHSRKRNEFVVEKDYLDLRDEFRNLVITEIKDCFNYVVKQSTLVKKVMTFKNSFQVCQLCKQTVRPSRTEMKNHSIIHSNISNLFKCLICKKCFNHYANIRRHVKGTHWIQKPRQNVHYLDNREFYSDKIEALFKKCYPHM